MTRCAYISPDVFLTQEILNVSVFFPQDTTLEQIVQQIEVTVGFVSKPKVIRDGKAATCVLRPPSAKELSQKEKNKTAAPQSDNSTRNTSPESNTHTTEGSVQQ